VNLQTRLDKLEGKMREANMSAYDLTLLTNAELIALEAHLSKAIAAGEIVRYTPELGTALERVKR